MRRSTEVFRRLSEGGQESQSTLWQQLTAFASATDPQVSRTGWKFAASQPGTSDAEGLNSFVLALSERVANALEDPDEWGLDGSAAGGALVGVCSARGQDLSAEAQEKISSLAIDWSR